MEDIRRRVMEAEVLRKAGIYVTESLDFQETVNRILNELVEVVPHDSACVLLLREGGYLEIVGGQGWPDAADVVGIRFPVPGDNPNTIVIQEGRPHILTNAPQEYPSFQEEPHSHIHSWLGVPLKVDGKVIGMVAIDSEKPNYFSKDHIRIVSSFADHVAIAIENAQLFNLATQAVNKRAVLHDVSQELISIKTERDQIYNAIHSAVTRLMPCDAFVITIMDQEEDNIVSEFVVDRGERSAPYQFSASNGLSEVILSTGESRLINDLTGDEKFPGYDFGLKDLSKAIIAVPMKSSGRVMGIISAQSYTPGVYSQDDVELLELLAAYAGIAIDNAQLLSEVGKLALTDSLTGLPNRRAFDFELKKEVARASRYEHHLVLLMLDIDDFKQYNDKYGHVAGDEHLKNISNTVCDCLREPDMVFRYGGEEISMILPFTDLKGGVKLAERIRTTIEKYTPEKAKDPGFTVSIGVAEIPSNSETALGLLQAADEALFAAKHMGKNMVYSAKGKIGKTE
jgi:diguanylate cyclase (GGDEF)-like protein